MDKSADFPAHVVHRTSHISVRAGARFPERVGPIAVARRRLADFRSPIVSCGRMAKRKKKVTVIQVGKKAFAYLVKRGLWRAR